MRLSRSSCPVHGRAERCGLSHPSASTCLDGVVHTVVQRKSKVSGSEQSLADKRALRERGAYFESGQCIGFAGQ